MNNNDLLDYKEIYPDPFNPSDLSLPVRWLTGLYLFIWGLTIMGVWIPWFNELGYASVMYNILHVLMGITVIVASNSKKRSNDALIKRYRVVVWIGMVCIIIYRLFMPLWAFGMGYGLLSQVGYYLAFIGLAVWLVRSWRLRASAGRWWVLWEQWSWTWAIGRAINSIAFLLRYGGDFNREEEDWWEMMNWGVYGAVLLLTLYLLVQYLSNSTEKERQVGRLSWGAFIALLLIEYNRTITLPYAHEAVALVGVGMVGWTAQVVLKTPEKYKNNY